eukprot:GHVL01010695.1.p2 GENE.GHVL01010695.1~~GHVL01010695.1.p2  ORF type:complete len:121 (-),score=10.39 GHVL01010695.1:79-441(-)
MLFDSVSHGYLWKGNSGSSSGRKCSHDMSRYVAFVTICLVMLHLSCPSGMVMYMYKDAPPSAKGDSGSSSERKCAHGMSRYVAFVTICLVMLHLSCPSGMVMYMYKDAPPSAQGSEIPHP